MLKNLFLHVAPAALVSLVAALRLEPSLEDFSAMKLRLKQAQVLLFSSSESLSWTTEGIDGAHWLADVLLTMVFALSLPEQWALPEQWVPALAQYATSLLGCVALSLLLSRRGFSASTILATMFFWNVLLPPLVLREPCGIGVFFLPLVWLFPGLVATAILTVVWINSDLSFVLFPAILLADLIWGESQPDALKRLGVCLLASLLNPALYGWWTELGSLIFAEHALSRLVYGFVTPNFQQFPTLAVGVGLTLVSRRFISVEFFERYLLVSFALMLLAESLSVLFAFVAALHLALLLKHFFSEKLLSTLTALVCGVYLVFLLFRCPLGFGPLPTRLPDFQVEGRVYNDLTLDGDLVFVGMKPFIDRRLLLYSDEVLRDYQALKAMHDNWEEILKKWSFDAAILRYDTSLATALREQKGWKMLSRTYGPVVIDHGWKKDQSVCLLVPPTAPE